jgi:hypothetical protein
MFALDCIAMVHYNGVTLEHFTPMSSPFSAGIDAFSQCYVDEKRTGEKYSDLIDMNLSGS